jgi:hypothetical protein
VGRRTGMEHLFRPTFDMEVKPLTFWRLPKIDAEKRQVELRIDEKGSKGERWDTLFGEGGMAVERHRLRSLIFILGVACK